MFAGINVCIFETKTYLQELIFAVSSELVNYLGTGIMIAAIYFRDLKVVANFANKFLANINEFFTATINDLLYQTWSRIFNITCSYNKPGWMRISLEIICYQRANILWSSGPGIMLWYTESIAIFWSVGMKTEIQHKKEKSSQFIT